MTFMLREWTMILMLLPQVSSTPPAAIVESLTGNAATHEPQQKASKPVRLYAWLAAGSTLSVERGSAVVLLFSNGSRWQFAENSTANLSVDGPSKPQGAIRLLGSVPPLPRVLPIAGPSPLRAGAVRLRYGAERIRDLYPFSAASTVPDKTSLRFSAIDGISTYQVEIQDGSGTPVFKTETKTNQVIVPPGLLQPGAHYRWQVRAVTAIGPRPMGETTFDTLSIENVARRMALHTAVRNPQDAASLALLAEIDNALGLVEEAVEGLTAAVAMRPGDQVLRMQLEKVQQLIKQRRD